MQDRSFLRAAALASLSAACPQAAVAMISAGDGGSSAEATVSADHDADGAAPNSAAGAVRGVVVTAPRKVPPHSAAGTVQGVVVTAPRKVDLPLLDRARRGDAADHHPDHRAGDAAGRAQRLARRPAVRSERQPACGRGQRTGHQRADPGVQRPVRPLPRRAVGPRSILPRSLRPSDRRGADRAVLGAVRPGIHGRRGQRRQQGAAVGAPRGRRAQPRRRRLGPAGRGCGCAPLAHGRVQDQRHGPFVGHRRARPGLYAARRRLAGHRLRPGRADRGHRRSDASVSVGPAGLRRALDRHRAAWGREPSRPRVEELLRLQGRLFEGERGHRHDRAQAGPRPRLDLQGPAALRVVCAQLPRDRAQRRPDHRARHAAVRRHGDENRARLVVAREPPRRPGRSEAEHPAQARGGVALGVAEAAAQVAGELEALVQLHLERGVRRRGDLRDPHRALHER